jgi:hypothetical protein
MMRNTKSGGVLEQMVLPALTLGGYQARMQVVSGRVRAAARTGWTRWPSATARRFSCR